MRHFLIGFLLSLLFLGAASMLSSCSTPGAQAVDVSAPGLSRAEIVRRGINEANIDITAIARTLADDVRQGYMTPQERDAVLPKLEDAANKLTVARQLLDQGQTDDAEAKAALVRNAIAAARSKLVELSRRK